VKYRLGQLAVLKCIAVGVLFAGAGSASGETGIAIRAQNFTVPPSTGPVTHILARNRGETACTITVEARFPDGWQWTPKQRTVTIEPHQTARLAFAIEKGADVKSNRYPIEITVVNGSEKTVHRQTVVCASAPYFKPKIDGKFKDWIDAIPITFTTGERKTVVSTFWSKQHFCLYVQVEEDKLYSYAKKAERIDAVQFALATRNAVTGSEPTEPARRYEFLLVNVAGYFARDRCFSLIKPGDPLSVTQEQRALDGLEVKEAQVVVKRDGRITRYECAIPFSLLEGIRPDVGREIRFSVLVHDGDGTGIRDFGKAAGLWPEQRNAFAWCAWGPVKFSAGPPYDSKVEWGLCSSKH